MHSADIQSNLQPAFELRFPSFHAVAHALAVALGAGGAIQLDALGERALNYLFARALLGHGYGRPTVLACREQR